MELRLGRQDFDRIASHAADIEVESCREAGLRQARPDAVLLDVRLQGQSGLEACRLITERFPGMAVVFLTGMGSILGPLASSVTMDLMGPDGFFWSIAAVHLAVGLFGLTRLARPPVKESPEPWLSVPARSTFVLRRNPRRPYRRNRGSWD